MPGLIQDLQALTAPSEEADAHIMWALGYKREQRHIGCTCWDHSPEDRCCPGGKHMDNVWVDPKTDKWVLQGHAFFFTREVDVGLRELARVLPGMRAALFTHAPLSALDLSKGTTASALIMRGSEPLIEYARAFNLATALSVAILKAMEKV